MGKCPKVCADKDCTLGKVRRGSMHCALLRRPLHSLLLAPGC